MIFCPTIEMAEEIAKGISKRELRAISIIQKRVKKELRDFVVLDKEDDFSIANYKVGRNADRFALLVCNFESPFQIYSLLAKDGSEIIECFPTKELADAHYEIIKYRKSITKNYLSDGTIMVKELKFKGEPN